MKLLHLDSSILGGNSASRTLSAAIAGQLAGQGADIVYRDLAADPLPHLTGEHFAARLGATPVSAELQQAIATDQAVLDEFLAADTVVIGAPFYNLGVPSQLKAWIDRVAVAGKTFRYTADGPHGLAGGKRVIVAATYGGQHPADSGRNFVEPYLRQVFAFLGITEVEFVSAEGLNISPELRTQALEAAQDRIDAILPRAA